MKRLVLFTAEFPFGLQETFLENEIDYLSKNFKEVSIVPLFGHEYKRSLTYKNVDILTPANTSRKLTPHKFILFFHFTFYKAFFEGLPETKLRPKALLKLLKQSLIIARLRKYIIKRPDLLKADIWYFYWGTNAINVLPFLKDHPKAIARYHRFDLYGPEIYGGEYQIFQKQVAKQLEKAVFITSDGADYFKENIKDSGLCRSVSRLGVPDRGLSVMSRDGKLRIVTCSNLYKVKRVHLLAIALQQITDIPIEWTHFGDGPKKFKMQLFKEATKLSPNINFRFMGRMSNLEVMTYYQNNPVDLFCNTSISEGLPVSIMEALSFGIPVFATDCGGVSELVDNSNGRLLATDLTMTGLSKCIYEFYQNDFGSEIKRSYARKSWANMVDASKNYKSFVDLLMSI